MRRGKRQDRKSEEVSARTRRKIHEAKINLKRDKQRPVDAGRVICSNIVSVYCFCCCFLCVQQKFVSTKEWPSAAIFITINALWILQSVLKQLSYHFLIHSTINDAFPSLLETTALFIVIKLHLFQNSFYLHVTTTYS